MMKQEACTELLLPLSPDRAERRGGCVLYEPDGAAVLNTLVSEYVAGKIYAAVKESFASEVAARRMAMDSAEKNAKQMISDLQLSYNRARQSAIAQERLPRSLQAAAIEARSEPIRLELFDHCFLPFAAA